MSELQKIPRITEIITAAKTELDKNTVENMAGDMQELKSTNPIKAAFEQIRNWTNRSAFIKQLADIYGPAMLEKMATDEKLIEYIKAYHEQ